MEARVKASPDPSSKQGAELCQFTTCLQEENANLRALVTRLQAQIQFQQEQLDWLKRQMFGKKSERIVGTAEDQVLYLPGFEPKPKDTPKSEIEDVPAHKRRKRKAKNDYSNGLLIPEDLPEEEIILDLDESEKVCQETGEPLVRIGEEITRRLALRSAEYFVKKFVRPKYAHPSREEAGVACKEAPDSILPGSKADESLLAEIVTSKFADHMPLYRLSERYSRRDIQITRQLLSQWMIRLGTTLRPLYELLLKEILDSKVLFIDESPVKLQVKGKGKLQTGYMWTVVGGLGADPPNRVYAFFDNRRHENAYSLLKDFSGIYHSDKYGAYEKLSKSKKNCQWQPCWSHIRRKFEEAMSGDLEFRNMFLRKVRYLFMFERIAWSRSAEERLRIRKEKEEPIIDELIAAVKKKMEEGKVLPKSKFGEALFYFYGLGKHVKTYLSHPDARLDNNVAERAIRPLAIGRKNWLFIGSQKSGLATAVLLSLVQTCRAQGINPQEYLEDVMRRFLNHPANKLSELLPRQWAKVRVAKAKQTPLHKRS